MADQDLKPDTKDEPQHVVRTFATDVATLGKQGAVDDGTKTKPVAVIVPAQETPVHAVHAMPVPAAPQAAPIHEDIVAEPEPESAPKPSPKAPETPPPGLPALGMKGVAEAVAAVRAPEPAPEASVGAERQSILERLRARVMATVSGPAAEDLTSHMSLGAGKIDTVASAPQIAGPVPHRMQAPAAPALSAPPAYERPAPPISRPPAPIYAPPAPVPAPAPSDSSSFHTFNSDFMDRAGEQRASMFSVLAAQEDAPRVVATASEKPRRSLWLAIAGAALVAVGGTGAFFAYRATHQPPVAVVPSLPSLVFADDRVELTGSGSALLNSLENAAASPLPDNDVRVAYLGISTTSAKGVTTTAIGSGSDFMNALGLEAPDILLRNVNPSSTIGIVHPAGETPAAFFILSVGSYDATFRGMLSWEPTMATDLAALYPPYPAIAAAAATSTATSTASSSMPVEVTPAASASAAQFIDETVSNHDVRALKDSAGRTILLYGYYDEQTLIIARDEAAFTDLAGRLGATASTNQ